jgi:hypothetical protein
LIKIVEIFKNIVERVGNNVVPILQKTDSSITEIKYKHGHPLEIIESLGQEDKAPSLRLGKYPLIALFQDFPERKGVKIGVESEVVLHIIIAKGTDPNYKASDRYKHNFNPFLYPIYEELLEQIYREPAFRVYSANLIDHMKYDRLYWGRGGLMGNDRNVFNDWLDCIELKNLRLKVNQKRLC